MTDAEFSTSDPWPSANADWDTDRDCLEEPDKNPKSDKLSLVVWADDINTASSGYQNDDMLPLADAQDRAQNRSGSSGYTIVKLRNVPVEYSHTQLASELNRDGFLGEYDFL